MVITQPIDVIILTKRTKFAVFVIFYLLVSIALIAYLFYLTKSSIILWGGMFIFMFYPFLFPKSFRKRFSQDVSVSFSDNLFSVEFKDLYVEDILRKDINRFSEIKYFRTWDSRKNDFSTLKLIFKDGRKVNYTFSGQENDDSCETDINLLFKNAVQTYNASAKQEDKIKIIPSFFSAKEALSLGVAFTFAMTFVIIYYGIKKPRVFIASFGFIVLFFQMVALRKKAIKEKNMFN